MGPVRRPRGKKKRRPDSLTAAAASSPASNSDGAAAAWCDGFSPKIAGLSAVGPEMDGFESVFKMTRKTFNYICSLVREDLMSEQPRKFKFSNGRALTAEDQVAISLRRLGSGESLLNIGTAIGINHATVSQITWRFVEAMEERGMHHLRWPTTDELPAVKLGFERMHGLPNCCGAVDATHVTFCMSSAEPNHAVWLDSEENHSMVLQAVVDCEMRFRDVLAGWPGSMTELQLLRSSGFYKQCEDGWRLSGKMALPNGSQVKEYIVGDAGYPLLRWLITPYCDEDLPEEKSEFNRRHAGTVLVAKQALAKFKDSWRIVRGEMWRPNKHQLPSTILVCCLLHNILLDLQDGAAAAIAAVPLSHDHDANYRQQVCSNAVHDSEGAALRDELARYLSGTTAPPSHV